MGLKKEKEERKPVNDNFSLGVNGCTTKFVKKKKKLIVENINL